MTSPETAPEQAESPDPTALSPWERDILTFEHGWWRHPGAKEQAILDVFGLSASRYYQTLHTIIDKPAALIEEPMLVKRLRSLRAHRAEARSAHHLSSR